ncbi:MAG: 4Fe-4S binding protein, partial [Pseudomonadota bacterium]
MAGKTCLICNCEGTMAPDTKALAKVDGLDVSRVHTQLCRAQLGSFEAALAIDDGALVACTQEAPLFEEVAAETGRSAQFVNIRETAGWSDEGAQSGPKMAALLAGAAYESTPAKAKDILSDGLCLIYGAGQAAVEMAQLLSSRLSVTLMLTDASDVILPPLMDFPVFRGRISTLTGSLGGFALTVDDYAPLRPASRGELVFEDPRNGATSNCSLVLDISGGVPLVTGAHKRDGYEWVDPGDPAAVLRAAFKLSDLVGTFEKPIYVEYSQNSCAHARSQITGCTRCLDACPAGAITENGDGVAVDSGICGGCGACAAVCPTDAMTYTYPARPDRLGQAQTMLSAYRGAGGKDPVMLIHAEAGDQLIGAMARFGRGLPARVIPWARHNVTAAGHVELCGLIAAGSSSVVIHVDPMHAQDLAPLQTEVALANAILHGLGVGNQRITLVETADPDVLETALWTMEPHTARPAKAITDTGSVRDLSRLIFTGLSDGRTAEPFALPADAPYGSVAIDGDACTLCMACTSACPTGAIMDTPGEPHLRFAESACVQCGLCVSTCPEKALTLDPRLNLSPDA